MKLNFTKRNVTVSLAVILTIVSHYYLKYFFAYVIFGKATFNALVWWQRSLLVLTLALIFCLLVAAMLSKFSFQKFLEMMGLDKEFLKPVLFAFIATLPMFIGNALLNGYQSDVTWKQIVWESVIPGFNEELVFRAFIVGILVRYANWNFIVAALCSGFLFANGHLYQASDFAEGVKIFLFVSGAGIGFSLLYKYWNWNIWFTIFLHLFMNLAFVLFVSNQNVLLNGYGNIFRTATIVLAILLTVYYNVKNKNKAEVVINKPV